MEKARSILFEILFYLFTIIYMTSLCIPMLILPRICCAILCRFWSRGVLFLMKVILKLSYVENNKINLDNAVKNGPVIIACKHQSAWETFFCLLMTDNFVIVLKKDLMRIPIYGSYLWKLNSIAIDRTQGIKSLKKLLADCKKAVTNGRSILIFPEGSRIPYGEKGTYHPGITAIYKELKIPVVPIGVNSGKFWPRKAKVKKSGCVMVNYGEPIPDSLSKEEFKQRLESGIEEITPKN